MVMEGENIEVNNFNFNTSDNDDVDELYDDLIKAKKNVSLSKKIITTLEMNIKVFQKKKKNC